MHIDTNQMNLAGILCCEIIGNLCCEITGTIVRYIQNEPNENYVKLNL